MNTTFEEIYEMFLLYTEAPEYAEMEELLAKDDLEKKLKDAMGMFTKAKNIIPNYETGEFNRELEQIEKIVLARYMVVIWLTPKYLKEDNFKILLGSKDYTISRPQGLLASLRSCKEDAEKQAEKWAKKYTTQAMCKYATGD